MATELHFLGPLTLKVPYPIFIPGSILTHTVEMNLDGCYGLTAPEMVSWIKDFSNTYLSATGR